LGGCRLGQKHAWIYQSRPGEERKTGSTLQKRGVKPPSGVYDKGNETLRPVCLLHIAKKEEKGAMADSIKRLHKKQEKPMCFLSAEYYRG